MNTRTLLPITLNIINPQDQERVIKVRKETRRSHAEIYLMGISVFEAEVIKVTPLTQ